jgi:hypothetical protein
MKPALRGTRHSQVAKVYGIEGSPKDGNPLAPPVDGFPQGGSAIVSSTLHTCSVGIARRPALAIFLPATPGTSVTRVTPVKYINRYINFVPPQRVRP